MGPLASSSMSSLWHPFASMGAVAGNEFVVDRGEGVWVYDTDGNRYLDATASLWYCQVGHGRAAIVDAIATQARRLDAYHTFGDFSNPPIAELAARIARYSPNPASAVFFTSGGSDSVDTAAKMARRYFQLTGEPERTVLITRDWAYHGMHGFGTSLAGIPGNADGYGDLFPDVIKVPFDSTDALVTAIEKLGSARIAGLFCEPVIGAGGVRPAPDGYLKHARKIIEDAGALFIADEVITGFCRTGDWFASNRFSLEPDLITFAKGVTSGYLPMGGVIAAPRVADPFFASGGPMFRHGYTYSGHPTVAAAALANLDILEGEGLAQRALQLEAVLVEGLETLTDHPLVGGHRSGVGFLGAVVLAPDALGADPDLPAKASQAVRRAGLISRAIGGDALQVSPPLSITDAEFDQLLALMRTGLDQVRVTGNG
ncbi:MAG: adenosylmethionine-8-amino-7-oxononanoate aminotransferase [Actinobacteria bacterium RBG_16_68_21]|nr:MAG: adenosylmethionine-8-amino-7-oxononanoate aminotransferase [Actinobacteria bacterium RBG_16_68_21]